MPPDHQVQVRPPLFPVFFLKHSRKHLCNEEWEATSAEINVGPGVWNCPAGNPIYNDSLHGMHSPGVLPPKSRMPTHLILTASFKRSHLLQIIIFCIHAQLPGEKSDHLAITSSLERAPWNEQSHRTTCWWQPPITSSSQHRIRISTLEYENAPTPGKIKPAFPLFALGSSFLPFEEVQQKWWRLVKSHDSSRCFSENTLKKMCMLSMFYCVRIHTWHAQIRKVFILKNSRPQDSEDSLQDGSASLPPSLQRAREPDLEFFRAVTVSGGEVTLSMDLRLRSWPAGPCGPPLPLKRTSFIQASKLQLTEVKFLQKSEWWYRYVYAHLRACVYVCLYITIYIEQIEPINISYDIKWYMYKKNIKISEKKNSAFKLSMTRTSALFFFFVVHSLLQTICPRAIWPEASFLSGFCQSQKIPWYRWWTKSCTSW